MGPELVVLRLAGIGPSQLQQRRFRLVHVCRSVGIQNGRAIPHVAHEYAPLAAIDALQRNLYLLTLSPTLADITCRPAEATSDPPSLRHRRTPPSPTPPGECRRYLPGPPYPCSCDGSGHRSLCNPEWD